LENIIAQKDIEIIELNDMLEDRIPKEDFEILLARHTSLEKMVYFLVSK